MEEERLNVGRTRTRWNRAGCVVDRIPLNRVGSTRGASLFILALASIDREPMIRPVMKIVDSKLSWSIASGRCFIGEIRQERPGEFFGRRKFRDRYVPG